MIMLKKLNLNNITFEILMTIFGWLAHNTTYGLKYLYSKVYGLKTPDYIKYESPYKSDCINDPLTYKHIGYTHLNSTEHERIEQYISNVQSKLSHAEGYNGEKQNTSIKNREIRKTSDFTEEDARRIKELIRRINNGKRKVL